MSVDAQDKTVPSTTEPRVSRGSMLSCTQCRTRKLKCDRAKPSCARCIKSTEDCTYPDSRRKHAGKRRDVKELESRLAQVEEILKEDKSPAAQDQTPKARGASIPSPDWDQLMEDINDSNAFPLNSDLSNTQLPLPNAEFVSDELIGLGLFEQLPSYAIIEDLTNLYFDKLHHTGPMLQRSRYIASLYLPHHMRPPMCLQYTVMALASTTSNKYSHLAMPFYQRARNYAESDEMKGQGEYFITLAHAQTWVLLSHFEAHHTMFARSSVSVSRSVRIAQILNLHYLDTRDSQWHGSPPTIPPPKDWCELEERRRTFWTIFCSDLLSSSITGWPKLINTQDIQTNLPASEEAFEQGIEEETSSLADALRPEALSYSPFAGKVLASHVFSCGLNHVFKTLPDDHPEDVKNGTYWTRHREIDNSLSTIFMFLPENLRLPRHIRDQNAAFVNLLLYSSVITLHRAAISKIKEHDFPENMLLRSAARLLPAADEILDIMRLMSHLDAAFTNPFVAFSVYVAASVFVDDFKNEPSRQCQDNLDFLLNIMIAFANRIPTIRPLAVELAVDMNRSGVDTSAMEKVKHLTPTVPPAPLLVGSDNAAPHRSFCPLSAHTESESIDIPYHTKSNTSVSQQFAPLPNFNLPDLPRNNTSESVEIGSVGHVLPGDPDLNFAQFDNGEF